MLRGISSDRPSIALLVDPGVRDMEGVVRAVGAGCEEEGVPLSWDLRSGRASELAGLASEASRLGVGVGFDGAGWAIALSSMKGRPPYMAGTVGGCADLRWVGQNAARLAKGVPLVLRAPTGSGGGGGRAEGILELDPSVVRTIVAEVLKAMGLR